MTKDCQDCRAAAMRHVLQLYRPEAESDGLGGFERTFAEAGRIRCAIKFHPVTEKSTGEVLAPAGHATATTRAGSKTPAGWHAVTRDGVEYTITGSDPVGRGERWKRFYLRRVENEGLGA